MNDQADQLRLLARETARSAASHGAPPPALLAIAGGKGGVGVSTLCVNVAVSLARYGHRTLLVDAQLQRGDIAPLCGLVDGHTLADVIASRRDLHEVLQAGPCGMLVLPGGWAPERPTSCSPQDRLRLIDQLRSMGRHTDVVVIDVGIAAGEHAATFCREVDRIYLVTTPDSVSIMDTYAAMKTHRDDFPGPVNIIVNQTARDSNVEDVFERLHQSCRRFLSSEIISAGGIPLDERVPLAAANRTPVCVEAPTAPFSRAVDRLSTQMAVEWLSRREFTNQAA